MKQRSAAPAIAGATALGGIIYYLSRTPQKPPEEQRRARAEHKKGEGLGSAGIGGNFNTGGHETGQHGSGVASSQKDDNHRTGTDAPLEKLPSGGVGGGVGGGGASARSIDMTGSQQPPGSSRSGSVSSALQGMLGTGGSTAGTGNEMEAKDTRVASNYAHTPSKKNAGGHDHHQPLVEKSK